MAAGHGMYPFVQTFALAVHVVQKVLLQGHQAGKGYNHLMWWCDHVYSVSEVHKAGVSGGFSLHG